MPYFGLRSTSLVLAVCVTGFIAACSDAPSKSLTAPGAIDRAVSAAALANATIHEIPALLNHGVNGMNDSDEVSGDSGGRPFKWSPAHGIQWLDTTGLKSAVATSISNNGGVAGFAAFGDSNADHGVVWLPNGKPRVFPLPPDSLPTSPEFSEPSCGIAAINVYGRLVGNCVIKDGFTSAEEFQWHGPTLNPPPGVPAANQLTSISDDGWIGSGNFGDMFGSTGAAITSPTGQTFTLRNHDGQLPILPSWVNAVTRHGWAAGVDFEGVCGQAVAWLDHPGQTYPEFRMGTCGEAVGLTDDWYVVGTGTDSLNNPASRWAFVWFPGPGLQRLPGFGMSGETSSAIAVNAKHHVLGQITDGSTVHTVIWYVGPRTP
ncbi:MAG TPA: hypothetical protein VFA43_06325 [Gemmatimonadaceae bacterium]|nr:hypothetical protein [Gemmatimonadaceae bacterium]